MTKQTTDTAPRPYQVAALGSRWVFAGCRNPGGYALEEEAQSELGAQLANEYVGPLNTGSVDPRTHRASARRLATLALAH